MKTPTKDELRTLVSHLLETASRMEGAAQIMQSYTADPNMVKHGQEMDGAAAIATSWAYEIEQQYELKGPSEIPSVDLKELKSYQARAFVTRNPIQGHVTYGVNAMKCTTGGIGDKVMNFVIESGLMTTECPDSPESGCITTWSANAAEQIEAFLADLARQGTVPCPLCGHSQNQP